MPKSVYIANLNPGTVRHEYVGSLITMLMYDLNHSKHVACYTPRMAGGCLGIYRNMSVQHFLDTSESDYPNLEWLLFLDSDIQLEPDTLERLVDTATANNLQILAGLYYMPLGPGPDGIVPSVFDYRYVESEGHKHMVPRRDIPLGELVECDGTGAGCLLIHKDVFLKLREQYGPVLPWFAESAHEGVAFGEDFTFCMRAKLAGIPTYVHTGIEVGHVKNIVLSSTNTGT